VGRVTATPRPRPCASCPYRCDVPAGVWEASEYAKLPRYDADTQGQPAALFLCHQRDETVCAGWLGVGDPGELLAVRIGCMTGQLDPSVYDYTTDVPLHDSHTAAARHGLSAVAEPPEDAFVVMEKILRSRRQSRRRTA
jgi:hypothetical protein